MVDVNVSRVSGLQLAHGTDTLNHLLVGLEGPPMAEEHNARAAVLQIETVAGGFRVQDEHGNTAFIPVGLVSDSEQLARLLEAFQDPREVVLELIRHDYRLTRTLFDDFLKSV